MPTRRARSKQYKQNQKQEIKSLTGKKATFKNFGLEGSSFSGRNAIIRRNQKAKRSGTV